MLLNCSSSNAILKVDCKLLANSVCKHCLFVQWSTTIDTFNQQSPTISAAASAYSSVHSKTAL